MSLGPQGAIPEGAQENNPDVEAQWAVQAGKHMETYWNILEKVKGSSLRLTKFDDEIYAHFQKDFPEIDVSGTLDQDALKSKEGKERWRKFMNEYENKVDDYNFGTMLRDSPKAEYGPDTTMMSVRMQFYAIEIARNRGGHNDWIYEKAHAK